METATLCLSIHLKFLYQRQKKRGEKYSLYDLEVTKGGGLFGAACSCVCIRFPNPLFKVKEIAKVTAFSGGTDLVTDIKDFFKYILKEDEYDLSKIISRTPNILSWYIVNNDYKMLDYFNGITFRLDNEKCNASSIEFYVDFAELEDAYLHFKNDKDAVQIFSEISAMLNEISIDITFHTIRIPITGQRYNIPNDEHIAAYGYDTFWIIDDTNTNSYGGGAWKDRSISQNNRSFTILVRD